MTEYNLQSRWKLEHRKLLYFGMRKAPYFLKHTLKINAVVEQLLQALPKHLTAQEKNVLKPYLDQGIVVLTNEVKTLPKSLEKAQFCVECVANDFLIPGIEFNDLGLCPMCEERTITQSFKSVLPVKNTFERSQKSRFDVALFYTGGKDSSYLLYYLAKVKKYRVLALTWEIPFISKSAKQSIENAKKHLDNVEFLSRKIADQDLKKIYRKLHQLSGNVCACPSLAYLMFYPDMVQENVPYFVVGNEPVQMLNLYFNRFAPKLAYREQTHKWLLRLANIFRVLSLKKPLKMGQLHTLLTMKQLAYKDPWFKRYSSYKHEILTNILIAFNEVKGLRNGLKHAIKKSSRTARIPAFVQIDFNDISGGHYDWKAIQETIKKAIGWVGPEDETKGLHTSCQIEKCKDHTQFIRFYAMESQMIPFSAIEVSLASRGQHISRTQAIHEINNHLGFSLESEPSCQIMVDYLDESSPL